MKKKILGITLVLSFAIGTAWNVNQKNNDEALANLVLNNIEALANGESGGSSCRFYCCQTKYNTCLDVAKSMCSSFTITLDTGC